MRVQTAVAQWWYATFFRWLDRRAPAADLHRLHLKNLYILPTLTGWMFLVLTALIWLLGTNYQNNLILALSYLQVSLFVVVILHTYNNLAGLRVRLVGAEPSFVGESVAFDLELVTASRHGSDNVLLKWLSGPHRQVSLEPGIAQTVRLSLPAGRRGRIAPGHLLLKSAFPLGLVRCWSYLRFGAETVVYPAPVPCDLNALPSSDECEGTPSLSAGTGEFWGFRDYAGGDSPKRISWKHYAREQGLVTKVVAEGGPGDLWLKWQDLFRGDRELCLSQLCFLALELSKRDQLFGLSLPGSDIAPGRGQAHLSEVLHALACFGE